VPDPAPPRPTSRYQLLWTSTSYFGEGLPWSFLHQLVTEFLTATGASNRAIASTSLFHLAVTLKFVWSPVVDLFGRKRQWLLRAEVVLAAGMALTALTLGNPTVFWGGLALLSVVHATHDIACDGFYIQALDERDRALYSGVRNAGYQVARMVGSSALVYLAAQTSWELAFASAGGLMLLTAGANSRILPHPAEQHSARGFTLAAFLGAYRSFFSQPGAARVLAFMLFYRLGDIMMFAMAKPMLRDIGVDTATRGLLNGAGLLTGVLGSLAGGAVISRLGLERCLIPMTYVQNLAIPLYAVLAATQPGTLGVTAVVLVESLCAGVGSAASAVFLMQRTSRSFSASHFAFATAVVSIGSTLSGYISGPLNEALGHTTFFSVAFVASWPSLVLSHLVPKAPLAPSSAPPSSTPEARA
jgi:PAT family beta-lactamase induction signal transducer AmpG